VLDVVVVDVELVMIVVVVSVVDVVGPTVVVAVEDWSVIV